MKLLSYITNLLSGFTGVFVGGLITYFFSKKLETNKLKEKQKLLCSILNDIIKQVQNILVNTFEFDINKKSPYGYIKSSYEEIETIMPLFDNIIAELSILPSSKNKTLLIELYSELKLFLFNNKKYKIKLENLKNFRKEMIPDNFVKLKCKNYMDYFSIDDYIFSEESNPNSIIDKDFFKAQKTIINKLLFISSLIEKSYFQLMFKMDELLLTTAGANNYERK